MIQLVKIEENTIALNTNMTSETFAKTRFAEKIKEKGVLAELNGNKWDYTPWTFDSTEEKDGIIFMTGTAFRGKIASEILEAGTNEEIQHLAKILCGVFEDSIETKAPVANIGCGGIIVSDDCKKVLFLPYNFWTMAVMSAGDETFSSSNGIYINQNQNRESAIRFTQAVLVYKAIAGIFPFAEKDTKKRSADILDGNYIFLKWTVPGINKELISFTERALSAKPTGFPSNAFDNYRKAEITEEELLKFYKDAEAAASIKKKKVQSKRFVRTKQTAIISISIATAIILLIAGNLRKTSLEKPTSKSLTSLETLEMYYTALNDLNVDAVKNCTYGLSDHIDAISNIFLKSRTRSMYDRQSDTMNPAAWLIKNQIRHNIFGLSQFYIDGKEGSLLVEGPRKNTNPEPLTEEDGIKIKNGDVKKFHVTYTVLDTTGEDLLAATKTHDAVEVTYMKDRWVVSKINTVAETTDFKLSEFIEDYLACMKPESHEREDVLAARTVLMEKYFFISTVHEIDEAYQYLKKISVFNFD